MWALGQHHPCTNGLMMVFPEIAPKFGVVRLLQPRDGQLELAAGSVLCVETPHPHPPLGLWTYSGSFSTQ